MILKALYKLKGQTLQGFKSLKNNQFFIYTVQGIHLPAAALHWFSNYSVFEDWCDMTALNKYAIQPGDVIIDIGAGIGEEIIVLSKRVGEQGKVYAIEANTGVFDVLAEVKSLNKLENTSLHNIAISTKNEDLELVVEGDSFLGGTIVDVDINRMQNNHRTYRVKGCRLDTFLEEQGIETVDLLKSNIEGAERFVVDSVSKEQLRKIKHVAISCHDFRYRQDGNLFFKTKQYVADFLVENGFEIISQNTGIGHVDDYIYGVNKRWRAAQ